jgi:hypothetical protein
LAIAEFCRQLADRPEQKRNVLRRGDAGIVSSVPDQATFKPGVKERAKKGRIEHQLGLTLRWQDGGKKRDLVQLG